MSVKIADVNKLEQSVIGCALLRESSIDDAAVQPEHFYHPGLREIWSCILAIRARMEPVDPLAIYDELQRRGVKAIGAAELAECVSAVPTAANAEWWGLRIREAAADRALCVDLGEILAMNPGPERLEALRDASARAESVRPEMAISGGEGTEAAVRRALERSTQRSEGVPSGRAVGTGLHALDDALGGGLHRGIVTVLGGRPGEGKSSLARQIALAAAARGEGAHVFSLEDNAETFFDRVVADLAGVELGRLRGGTCGRDDLSALPPTVDTMRTRPLLVDDRHDLSSSDVAGSVRRHRRDLGTRLVVVDYVQLMADPGDRTIEIVGNAVRGLVSVARREDVAVLLVSQLSRANEKENRPPRMSDLRESGELEQHARVVLFPHHAKNERGQKTGEAKILVAKNNNGPSDVGVRVAWHAAQASFGPADDRMGP